MELEADETAGHILYLLGATLADAQRVMYSQQVPQEGTMTHPSREQRLKAIEKGYMDAKSKYILNPASTVKQDPTTNPPPMPTAKQDPIQNPTTVPTAKQDPTTNPTPVPTPKRDPIQNPASMPTAKQEPTTNPTPVPTAIRDPIQNPTPVPTAKQEPTTNPTSVPPAAQASITNTQPASIPATTQPEDDGIQSIRNNMVLVKGGPFIKGCSPGSDSVHCWGDEKPAHQVIVSDFYIGKYEVTQKEWLAIMGSEGSIRWLEDCDNCPATRVSWDDIQIFLQKLNERTGKSFRLPTETEWEFAARGGTKSAGYRYAGGNQLDEVAWHSGNCNQTTQPVGKKKSNELGLYDMSGNVWEWCHDFYEFGYYKTVANTETPPTDPKGPLASEKRVVRGGSWDPKDLGASGDVIRNLRVSHRASQPPAKVSGYVGFRLAMSL